MFKIFYSWESELPGSKNSAFIRDCINKAIELADNAETIEAERDEATKDLPGSPDIVLSIFRKINECDLFVADVSLCYEYKSDSKTKKSPNPNVLIELGYAIHVLGWERIICVFNLAYGVPEELPFDIQHHRLLKYSFNGKSANEVKMTVAEAIFMDIRDLRNLKPLIKEGVPLHVVGSYDPNEKKVCQCLLPINLKSRIDAGKISKLKASAKCLYETVNELTEKMISSKTVPAGSDEGTIGSLEALQKAYDFDSIRHMLDSISSITNPPGNDAKPVAAYRPDLVKHWLSMFFNVEPSEEFFSFGSLSKSVLDFGPAGKNVTWFGTENEKEKYKRYNELYRTLYILWLFEMFPKTFDDYLFFPIALQNISHTKDNDIRIIFSLTKGEAIYPTKKLIAKVLESDRGRICREGLVDKLFSLPQIPMIEQEYSPLHVPRPRYHMGLWGMEQDAENEEDYENKLQQFILSPESKTHYSTTIASLRAGESRWLCGGLLIKPDDGEVVVDYCIHSALLPSEMKGSLTYNEKKK